MGWGANASAHRGIAIGLNATSTREGGMAIGYNALSTGLNSYALGWNTSATNERAYAMVTVRAQKEWILLPLVLEPMQANKGAVAIGIGANATGESSLQ